MKNKKVTKDSKKVDKMNEASIEERLANVDDSKKEKQSKERIYKGVSNDMTYEEQKKYRGKMRRRVKRMRDDILIASKQKNKDKSKDAISAFKTFYKETYVKNDLTIESIYQGRNETDKEEFNLMLEIVKSTK